MYEIIEQKVVGGGKYIIRCRLPHNHVTPWVNWRTSSPGGEEDLEEGYYARTEVDSISEYRRRSR